ncbi:beta-glucosidase BglX [uncultured Alistipes sp.]|uniref:beta-glucosidase BglX n=1 Tax=uncultured Alistipes sp. TaxID=538949 RepID=UPI0026297435|nr:beta-glucosidase BglX [uncultured Alistipes sp.]
MGAVLCSAAAAAGASDDAAMDRFIDKLMSRMTLAEKIGQLNLPSAGDITTGQAQNSDIAGKIRRGEVGGLFNIKGVEKIRDVQRIAVEESRLGIPLIFGMDVVHGYETTFPIPLALAATWDMEGIERAARIAAIEASAAGICWTFSPMVDISRDPRWGRMAEGIGEDPFLGSAISRAFVYGYQGRDPKHFADDEIMGCVKHFALYGAAEAGRDYNTTDMSRQRMYNEYLPPYKAAVEAGVGSVMASFNEVDGIPATANKWLMTDLLRDQWHFDGFVVTDYTGILEMIAHGIGDLQEVSARAIEAGVDMDMVSEGFLGTLEQSLEEGRIPMSDIDRACRLILEAKYKLGLFDDPYRYCDAKRAATRIYTPEHRAEARRIATESFVLLKNEGGILPLQRKGTVAVIGPLASSRENMPGTWSVAADLKKPLTVVEGMRQVAGDKVEILYAKGSNLVRDEELERNITVFGRDVPRDGRSDREMLDEALAVASRADVVVAVLGEPSEMSGESSSRSEIGIPDVQQELLQALVATGKPVVLVLFAGRAMTLGWEAEHVPSILNVWFGGTQAAEAISDVLFGDVNPSGKLPVSFPRSVGQIPLFYNHKNTGRPHRGDKFEKFRSNYLDVPNTPQYAFGYGLSYTTFDYGDVRLSADKMSESGSIEATVRVTNSGKRDGVEVVQLYIRDLVGTSTRPVKELKGFRRVALKAGESKDVTFTIDASLLKYYNYDLQYVCEPGDFDVMIGGSSDAVRTARFTLEK